LNNLKNTFFKLFDIDLKNLTEKNKKMLYYNIFFPGTGFFYGLDYLRGFLLGGMSILFVCAGILIIGKNFPKMFFPAIILFGFAVFFHLLAIVVSTKVKVKGESVIAANIYMILSFLPILVSVFFLMKDLQTISSNFSFYLQ